MVPDEDIHLNYVFLSWSFKKELLGLLAIDCAFFQAEIEWKDLNKDRI